MRSVAAGLTVVLALAAASAGAQDGPHPKGTDQLVDGRLARTGIATLETQKDASR